MGDVPRVKKKFSQLSQDIKDLKRDVKVDKDIEQKISDVSKGTGALSRGKNASNDPSFKIAGAKGPKSMKDVQLPSFVQNVTRPRTRGERIQGAAVNTALKTMIPGLAGAQAGLEVSQGKYTDATLSAVQAMGGPIGFGAGVLRAVRQFRGTDAPRSAKTVRNPVRNVGVNKKLVLEIILQGPNQPPSRKVRQAQRDARLTGVRDILQGPNQPPSFDIKGAKGPKNMKDVELPKVDRKPKPESKPETKPEGRRRSKGGTKTGSLRKVI